MPFYQITFHGSGFNTHIEGGDKPLIGFYTVRRVWAADSWDAKRLALDRLEQEEKVEWLRSDARSHGSTPAIQIQEVDQITLWNYLFGSYTKGFIFYSNEFEEDEEQEHSA
ncbi:hypothetical protein [Verrucomicrobium sp. BvORR106]|uniref:hypothetical protein n=1 Tax=Verrucomicrobium sp. BvORR106 TaxID=1403819 RepID=UPI00056E05B3|nr:hypothetical protein [Verrucomicrobium sp. BvORR106]